MSEGLRMQSDLIRNSLNGGFGYQHSGYLLIERAEAEGFDTFIRRFFILDQQNGRLDYFADDRAVSVTRISPIVD
jgi:hypothetical protein